jgi:Fe-S-cluster formation regulator IscX/YfhJ
MRHLFLIARKISITDIYRTRDLRDWLCSLENFPTISEASGQDHVLEPTIRKNLRKLEKKLLASLLSEQFEG